MVFKWASSLKFKITVVFAVGIAIAFSINWYIALKTIHTEKEQDVEKVLHHLLVESKDEYLDESLLPSSNLSFLYSIPHIKMILKDSEVSGLRLRISDTPFVSTENSIVSHVHLSSGYYLNAISDHRKIDRSVIKYGQKLLFRYLISLIGVLIIIVFVLHYYMRPLSLLAEKTREWKKDEPFDIDQKEASSEIKEVAQSFSALVKRLEMYRLKEAQLFKEAAHELKTPLALIRSRLDVYEQSDNYEKSKFLAEFSRDVERLTTELKSVLFLESSDFEEESEVDIQEMLRGIKEKMEILIHRKKLVIDICEETFIVTVPKKLIYKVFGALIENATTYATERSRIEIDIDPNFRSIRITNRIGNDKYLFSSKIGSKVLNRLSTEIGYKYSIEDHDGVYSIMITFC